MLTLKMALTPSGGTALYSLRPTFPVDTSFHLYSHTGLGGVGGGSGVALIFQVKLRDSQEICHPVGHPV